MAGLDVVQQPTAVRSVIGLAGQYAAVDEMLTGRENLEMVGRLYRLSGRVAKQRAEEALERLGLTDAADRPVRTYSGGMRRRLDLGASLVGQPRILILDEPTTGLDPTRMELWDFMKQLVRDGTTVLLTTQYLEEADALASSIVVIDHGRVIAGGRRTSSSRSSGATCSKSGWNTRATWTRSSPPSPRSVPSRRRSTATGATSPSRPPRGPGRSSARCGRWTGADPDRGPGPAPALARRCVPLLTGHKTAASDGVQGNGAGPGRGRRRGPDRSNA